MVIPATTGIQPDHQVCFEIQALAVRQGQRPAHQLRNRHNQIMTNRLVVFIHGLGGDSVGTWAKFPELLAADAEVTSRYSAIESFGYETSKTGATRPLAEVAFELANFLDAALLKSSFDEIALITHSQGGLLARRYLCNLLLDEAQHGKSMPIFRLLTFATPHWGAYSEKGGWAVPSSRAQLKELAYDSESILSVNNDWVRADAEDRVRVQRVIAFDDAIVPKFSALGANFAHDYRIVPGHGHIDIVKVNDVTHPSFAIAKDFLLEPTFHQPALLNVDKTPPVLSCRVLDRDNVQGTARFVYLTRYVPFVGRDNELARISAFLHSPSATNMSWMWIKGQGGVGKSRLALEFCLAWQADWHAGFLNRDADAPDWTRWQPQLPTLLVVDYATGDTEKLGRLLRGLCNRDPQRQLRRPVRVLLLDRHQQENRLQQAIGQGADALSIDACRAPDIELVTVYEPWAIIEHFLRRAAQTLPAQAETLARLAQIDPACRPLFAMLLAEEIAQNSSLAVITRESLLSNVLAREREKYWRPAANEHGIPLEKAEFLLAFATMVGGLPLAEVQGPLEQWDATQIAGVFEIMSAYTRQTDTIAPLAPDLLGECFVTKTFTTLSNKKASDSLLTAWDCWPRPSFEFFDRLAQDFPENQLLDAAARRSPSNRFSRLAWSSWIVNLIARTAKLNIERARQALMHLTSLASAHLDEPEIRREQARGAFNLIDDLVNIDREAAKEVFSDLCALASAHPADFGIRLARANAAVNLTKGIASSDAASAKAVFVNLCELAIAHHHEPELRLLCAQTATNLINGVVSNDSTEAVAAFVVLCALAGAYANEPEIRLEQAKGAFNLVHGLGSRDATAAKSFFSDLCTLASAHPNEPEIALLQAEAAFDLISTLVGSDPIAAKELLVGLYTLASAYPDESGIRLWQGKAAVNMINGLASSDSIAAKSVFADLRVLADSHPEDAETQELFLRGATLIVRHFAQREPEWVEQLLSDYGANIVAMLERLRAAT